MSAASVNGEMPDETPRPVIQPLLLSPFQSYRGALPALAFEAYICALLFSR